MAPHGVVGAVDVSGNVPLGIGAREEGGPPDQFGFQRLDPKGGEANNVSTIALSYQLPLPDIEIRMPWRRSMAW